MAHGSLFCRPRTAPARTPIQLPHQRFAVLTHGPATFTFARVMGGELSARATRAVFKFNFAGEQTDAARSCRPRDDVVSGR